VPGDGTDFWEERHLRKALTHAAEDPDAMASRRAVHLRERSQGHFRGADYAAAHCELGGHPTPEGARAIIAASELPRTREVILSETARHGTSAWNYLKEAVALWTADTTPTFRLSMRRA
jgi:hypothetical protein